jgi:hypothetical protein
MDPISLILAALVAGASAAVKETAGDAIKNGYNVLKALIVRRFKDEPDAQGEVDAVERAPDADHTRLRQRLQATGASADEDLVRAARELLERIDPEGARAGKYNVTVTGGKVGAIGDHANVTMK